MAYRALLVVIAFQIYRITRSPLALGWLGLVEAVPAISLVLIGGYVADHFNRRRILLVTRLVSTLCALTLAFLSWEAVSPSVFGLYFVIFLAGIARGFADPASAAFEAQIVPKALTVNASSWISSTWVSAAAIGPAIIGFVFDAWGAKGSYLLISVSFVVSWFCTFAIKTKPMPMPEKTDSIFKSIGTGWHYVWNNQVLLGALALDLFAVLFGGAVALLPIYADEILHVGARGLGLLNAAPFTGSLFIMLFATRYPPMARAGRNLLLVVAGFGVSILVFAFSKNFLLSMAALFLSGVFDGVSVVIRRSILRLLSPDHLRGRVAAANFIFICASNELGAFESGMVAALIGTIPCVAVGGALSLGIVGVVAVFFPKLRRLRFDVHTLEQTHGR
jgi:MFS family permease